MRLVSIAPSNTELIFSLNSGDGLIGVSNKCAYPPQAKSIEKVGDFKAVKLEKLARLKPDLILLASGQESIAHTLKKHGFAVEILDNSTIDKMASNIVRLGNITGHIKEARQLSAKFDADLKSLRKLTGESKIKPRVFICVWPNPLMSAGKDSFMDQCISACGGTNCTGDLNQPYPRINPERLLLMRPELIIIPNEVRNEKFWEKTPWKDMKAVKDKKFFILPQYETDCLYRPTLRIKDALYWLALTMHPEQKAALEKWKNQ